MLLLIKHFDIAGLRPIFQPCSVCAGRGSAICQSVDNGHQAISEHGQFHQVQVVECGACKGTGRAITKPATFGPLARAVTLTPRARARTMPVVSAMVFLPGPSAPSAPRFASQS